MLIVCQNCGTSYQIDSAALGPTGRSVRCVRCDHVWFAANTGALSAISEAHRSDLAALGTATALAKLPAPQRGPDPAAGALPQSGHSGPDLASAPVPEIDATPNPIDEPLRDAPLAEWGSPEAIGETANPLAPGAPGIDGPQPDPFPIIDASPVVPPAPAAREDIESVAARRAGRQPRRRQWHWPVPALSTAVLALIALDLGLIAWRGEVVRWLPQTASLYEALHLPVNLRGLVFANVTTQSEVNDGVQVLVIEGTIVSAASRVVAVPRLRFAVRNASANEIYAWTALPEKSVLAPGEALAFRSRLASPPRETHDLLVRFFNRRDLVAGIQ
jgi:predicted Zn finger-like uncharacterized protein